MCSLLGFLLAPGWRMGPGGAVVFFFFFSLCLLSVRLRGNRERWRLWEAAGS